MRRKTLSRRLRANKKRGTAGQSDHYRRLIPDSLFVQKIGDEVLSALSLATQDDDQFGERSGWSSRISGCVHVCVHEVGRYVPGRGCLTAQTLA